jgi:hypothetical protein
MRTSCLVDKSLVRFASAGTGPGPCWLETVRQYAAGRLDASLGTFSRYQATARTLYHIDRNLSGGASWTWMHTSCRMSGSNGH